MQYYTVSFNTIRLVERFEIFRVIYCTRSNPFCGKLYFSCLIKLSVLKIEYGLCFDPCDAFKTLW